MVRPISTAKIPRLLKRSSIDPNFSFHPKCKKLNLVQLGFADDLMIICKANVHSLRVIKIVLL